MIVHLFYLVSSVSISFVGDPLRLCYYIPVLFDEESQCIIACE